MAQNFVECMCLVYNLSLIFKEHFVSFYSLMKRTKTEGLLHLSFVRFGRTLELLGGVHACISHL